MKYDLYAQYGKHKKPWTRRGRYQPLGYYCEPCATFHEVSEKEKPWYTRCGYDPYKFQRNYQGFYACPDCGLCLKVAYKPRKQPVEAKAKPFPFLKIQSNGDALFIPAAQFTAWTKRVDSYELSRNNGYIEARANKGASMIRLIHCEYAFARSKAGWRENWQEPQEIVIQAKVTNRAAKTLAQMGLAA